MTHDLTWTPHEVKVLRKAQHLSQRSFAEHLGFAQSTVANWEKATRDGTLHHQIREMLIRELDRLSAEHRERFHQRCSVSPCKLGAGSATRTRHIINSLGDVVSPLPYYAPASAAEEFSSVLSSATRFFLLPGPAGTGKTQLTHHLADRCANDADLQIFAVTEWTDEHVDLASEVLRYASIPPGQDALLTLEDQCTRVSRPCVVVIDGVSNDHDRVHRSPSRSGPPACHHPVQAVVSAACTLKPIYASLTQNRGARFLPIAGIELDVPARIEGVYPEPLHAEDWETAGRTCSRWASDQAAPRFARKFDLSGTAEEIADRASGMSGGLPPARRLLRSPNRPGRERGHLSATRSAQRGMTMSLRRGPTSRAHRATRIAGVRVDQPGPQARATA